MNTKKGPHGTTMVHGAHLDSSKGPAVVKRPAKDRDDAALRKATAKRRARRGAVAFLVLSGAGCTAQNVDVVSSADTFLQLTGQEYLGYVDNDESLTLTEKQIRHGYYDSFDRVVQAAKE